MTKSEFIKELCNYMIDGGSDYYNTILSLSLLNREPSITSIAFPDLNLELTRKLEKSLVESIDRKTAPEKTLAFVQSKRLLKRILQ